WVVLVDFWTFSSPNARQLIPAERQLTIRLKDRPFVQLGVTGEKGLEAMMQMSLHEINWRSFKNQRADDDTVAKAWGVRSWPTLFLLDHRGIVRHKWSGRVSFGDVQRGSDALRREGGTQP